MTRPSSGRRRTPDAAPVLVPLDPGSRTPLHRQVYEGLREAILAGRLAPGARVPSTRALASDLGVARNTIALAFDQLRAEGYIVGHRGGGTRVRTATPDATLAVRPLGGKRSPARAPRPPLPAGEVELSARGRLLARMGRASARRGGTKPVPFRLGVPALDAFPADLWARLAARRWRRGGVRLSDADPGGDPALRSAVATYVANARGARCGAEQVFVVNGSQQALDLVARILVDPGDTVCVEDPGYPDGRVVFLDAGARIVATPVDDEGLDVAAAEGAAPRTRLVYVTPSHQFPLGAVMSASRRLALLAWAHRAGTWIVEDDYDSEFRYAGRPLPCLQGLEADRYTGEGARVIYIGTFSKTLVPGFRLGYLILPRELVEPFRAARASIDRYAPTTEQGVLADFIAEGHYARHVRRVRLLYAARQEALLDAAAAELTGLLALAPDVAGMHLVGRLPRGVDDAAAAAAASAAGIEVHALSRFRLAPSPDEPGGLLINYAGFDERAIRAGTKKLRQALESLARRGG